MYRKIWSVLSIDLRPRKIDIGHRNDVRPIEFPVGSKLPYDPEVLYCYLMEQAEQAFIPATAQAVVKLFEEEFASEGEVPPRVIRAVKEELQANEIATASKWDDLRRVAVVTSFVDQYSQVYASYPSKFSNPRSARISWSTWIQQSGSELTDALTAVVTQLRP